MFRPHALSVVVAEVGADLELVCETNGYPVFWTLPPAAACADHIITGTMLRILDLQPSQASIYKCYTLNEFGSDSTEFLIYMEGEHD